MQKKNILTVIIAFALTTALYCVLFSLMDSGEFSSEEDSSIILFSFSVVLAFAVTLGSLFFTFIVGFFYRKTNEMKHFYNKKFLIVFLIGWILTVLMSMTIGISA